MTDEEIRLLREALARIERELEQDREDAARLERFQAQKIAETKADWKLGLALFFFALCAIVTVILLVVKVA